MSDLFSNQQLEFSANSTTKAFTEGDRVYSINSATTTEDLLFGDISKLQYKSKNKTVTQKKETIADRAWISGAIDVVYGIGEE